jgi:hypothetical protein
MRRADIARVSRIPTGADYIFTLLLQKSEGPASDSGLSFAIPKKGTTHYLTIRCGRIDQSLRGQTPFFERGLTSHGIVLISSVHEMVGVHCYKLVLLMLFPASHPIGMRCQTSPSLWTLGGDQPVIPGVAFIR